MKNRKIILDRGPISSQEIAERQDFDKLLKSFKAPPNPYWKSIWFWGTTGVATLGLFLLTKQFLTENETLKETLHEENITLALNGLPQDTECIKSPVASVEIPFVSHEIDPSINNEIILENGTTISIKAGSIETISSGRVVIKTRLFEDKTTAFLAGVPMDFKNSAFESAGMIEIRGEQEGKEVFVRTDQPIEVDLKLYKDYNGFDFYALDDQSGKWSTYPCEFLGGKLDEVTALSETDKKKTVLTNEIQSITTQISEKENDLLEVSLPRKETYYLPKNEQYIFTLDYNKRDFPELAALGPINFEAYPNQANYENIFKKSWSNFTIEEVEGKYSVTFSDKLGKESLKVRPIVTGIRLEEAIQEYYEAKQDAQAKRDLIEAEREQLVNRRAEKNVELQRYIADMEKRFNASNVDYLEAKKILEAKEQRKDRFVGEILKAASAKFRTTQFGVFNCDKPVGYPKPFENFIRFEIAGKVISPEAVYVFDLDKDVRYQFGSLPNPLSSFGMNGNENVVMIILENNEVAYAHTSKASVKQSGSVQLNVIPAEKVTEGRIKSILNEERVSA